MRALPIAFLALLSAQGQDWSQWRGPNRNGALDAELAELKGKPKIRWEREVGEGYSSPVVAGDRVYIHARSGDEEFVYCFNLGTGEEVWKAGYAAPFKKNQYALKMSKGPFATPLVAAGRLFTLGGTNVLTAYDAVTGKRLWRVDQSGNTDTTNMFTGAAMSPLYDNGRVIAHLGDDRGGAMTAFDAATGKPAWELSGDGPGYASPVVATLDGVRQIITMTDRSVLAVNPADGARLWAIPFKDQWNENIVTPVVSGGLVIVSGVRNGTMALRPKKIGASWSVPTAWKNTDIAMYMSTPVLDGTLLYGLGQKRKGQIFCMDSATGKVIWSTPGRSAEQASFVATPTRIWLTTAEGDLVVLAKNPKVYQELARHSVAPDGAWAHLTPAGRRVLLVKNGTRLVAYELGS